MLQTKQSNYFPMIKLFLALIPVLHELISLDVTDQKLSFILHVCSFKEVQCSCCWSSEVLACEKLNLSAIGKVLCNIIIACVVDCSTKFKVC